MELNDGQLYFSWNTGDQTVRSFIGSENVNDGSFHTVLLQVIGNVANITVDESLSIRFHQNGSSGNLHGPLYVGGVNRWTPEILDDIQSDTYFLGCIQVGLFTNK